MSFEGDRIFGSVGMSEPRDVNGTNIRFEANVDMTLMNLH